MKKYWKITVIITVVLLSIGTFYINSAMSAESYPEFIIQTQKGDAEEIAPLVLEGSYQASSARNYISREVKVTADGSTYRSDSFLGQIIGEPPARIKELQEEYHTFMRGKTPLINLFFENDRFLAYAEAKSNTGPSGASDARFAISILDKDKDDTTSFSIKVPDRKKIDYVFVNDVQITDNELNITTRNMKRNNGELHVYSVDLSSQKVSSHETVVQTPQGQNTQIDAHLIGGDFVQANQRLIFLKTEQKLTQGTEPAKVESSSQELISYNLETKEKKKMDLPDNINLEENKISYFDGSTIYFVRFGEDELVITPFHIENDQTGSTFTIQWPNETGNMATPIVRAKDGKLYVASVQMKAETRANIAVADIKTKETIYLGKLMRKNNSEEIGKYDLYFHDLHVK